MGGDIEGSEFREDQAPPNVRQTIDVHVMARAQHRKVILRWCANLLFWIIITHRKDSNGYLEAGDAIEDMTTIWSEPGSFEIEASWSQGLTLHIWDQEIPDGHLGIC